MIASRIPYPPISGATLKNLNLLRILSRHYNVSLVIVSDEKLSKEARENLEKYCRELKVFYKPVWSLAFAAAKTFFTGDPLQVNYYYFKDVQKYINIVAEKSDVVISTLVRTSQYALSLDKPKIFDMADSIGQNYKNSMDRVHSLFWKLIYKYESERLIKYERVSIANFDKTFMFNRQEIKYFDMPEKIRFIPHGVNEDLLRYRKYNGAYKNHIAFIGKMDYQPNIDAALWFVENILPHINKELTFIIIGAKPVPKIIDLQNKFSNVKVTGFVEDPFEIIASSLCVVAPMQTGAGIQNKVLESMALGTINIITDLAAKPIGGVGGEDYFVVDDPLIMANTINHICEKPEVYQNYKTNSRNFIKRNFTWSIYENIYIDTIEEITKKGRSNDNKK